MDWAPSLHLGHNKVCPGRSESQQERDRRADARKRKREEMEQEIQDEVFTADMDVGNDEIDDGTWDKETQTMSTGELVVDFFDEQEFVKDDQKVKYYTGLPKGELLMEVFKLVIPFPANRNLLFQP